jgi:hypothetical protein
MATEDDLKKSLVVAVYCNTEMEREKHVRYCLVSAYWWQLY